MYIKFLPKIFSNAGKLINAYDDWNIIEGWYTPETQQLAVWNTKNSNILLIYLISSNFNAAILQTRTSLQCCNSSNLKKSHLTHLYLKMLGLLKCKWCSEWNWLAYDFFLRHIWQKCTNKTYHNYLHIIFGSTQTIDQTKFTKLQNINKIHWTSQLMVNLECT